MRISSFATITILGLCSTLGGCSTAPILARLDAPEVKRSALSLANVPSGRWGFIVDPSIKQSQQARDHGGQCQLWLFEFPAGQAVIQSVKSAFGSFASEVVSLDELPTPERMQELQLAGLVLLQRADVTTQLQCDTHDLMGFTLGCKGAATVSTKLSVRDSSNRVGFLQSSTSRSHEWDNSSRPILELRKPCEYLVSNSLGTAFKEALSDNIDQLADQVERCLSAPDRCADPQGFAAAAGAAGTPNSSLLASGARAQGNSPPATTGCPSNLAHLAPALPRYSDPSLVEMRDAILATDIKSSLVQARAQGLSMSEVARLALQQADEAERVKHESESCVRQAASDPERVLRQLERGTFDPRMSASITDTCAALYIAAYMNALANREIAVATACLANAGR